MNYNHSFNEREVESNTEDVDYNPKGNKNNKRNLAIILIIFGCILFIKRSPVFIHILPSWFYSSQMMVIAFSLALGYRNKFKNKIWLVIAGFGALSLLNKHNLFGINLSNYFFPLILIAVGLYIYNQKDKDRKKVTNGSVQAIGAHEFVSKDNHVSIDNIFGGYKTHVISADFKGGVISSVFGGAELDLTQSDILNNARLDFNLVCGGVELLIPSNWIVVNNLMVIGGNVDDKRKFNINNLETNDAKYLHLNGTIILGSVEIKSY